MTRLWIAALLAWLSACSADAASVSAGDSTGESTGDTSTVGNTTAFTIGNDTTASMSSTTDPSTSSSSTESPTDDSSTSNTTDPTTGSGDSSGPPESSEGSTTTAAVTSEGPDSSSTSASLEESTGTPSVCGDGSQDADEACDDGNREDNDGCDGDCVPSAVIQVVAGGSHTCALTRVGSTRCWGRGTDGMLGYDSEVDIGDNETPASRGDVMVGGVVAQLTAGTWHTCALRQLETVRCWGDGVAGQLGYGNTNDIGDNEVPSDAGDVDIVEAVVQVSAGEQHTCAVLETAGVRCWGLGLNGRLGYGNVLNIGDDEAPADIADVDVGADAIEVRVGDAHSCALVEGGAVRCWGLGSFGRLGYGNIATIGDDEAPSSAGNVDVGGTVVQLALGEEHTCALLEGGTVRCWGRSFYGQLGYGNTSSIGDDESPASAGDVDIGGVVVQISAGRHHTCAILDGGSVRCWGFDGLGYANDETIGNDETPASAGDVDVGGTAVQVGLGDSHTCVLLDTGAVRCWGAATSGQLGYGNEEHVGYDNTPASAGDVPVFEP